MLELNRRMGRRRATYLNTDEKEVEVEVKAAQDVFVGDGHQDAAATVCKNRYDGAVGEGSSRCGGRPRRRSIKGTVGLLLAHLDGIVLSFLVVSHHGRPCCAVYVAKGPGGKVAIGPQPNGCLRLPGKVVGLDTTTGKATRDERERDGMNGLGCKEV